jgi:hypothetical protein
MATGLEIRPATTGGGPVSAPTPGLAVLGWLLVVFAIAPLAMAAAGDGDVYLWIGLTLACSGGVMIVLARRKGSR